MSCLTPFCGKKRNERETKSACGLDNHCIPDCIIKKMRKKSTVKHPDLDDLSSRYFLPKSLGQFTCTLPCWYCPTLSGISVIAFYLHTRSAFLSGICQESRTNYWGLLCCSSIRPLDAVYEYDFTVIVFCLCTCVYICVFTVCAFLCAFFIYLLEVFNTSP